METTRFFNQLSFWAAILVVFLLSGCATVGKIFDDDGSPQIHTSVSVVPKNPRVGDTIEIEISLENISGGVIDLHFNSGGHTGYSVYRDGKLVTPHSRRSVQFVSRMSLVAGEIKTVTHKLELVEHFRYAEQPGNLPGYFRGEYELRAGISGHGDQYPWAVTSFAIRQ